MPNSDSQDGVHNKITKDLYFVKTEANGTIISPHQRLSQSFSGNVDTAKAYFLTSNALDCIDTNATQAQFAITADGNGLTFTVAFGTKGAGTAEGDDWAALYKARKDALIAADDWIKGERQGTGDAAKHAAWGGGNGTPYTWLVADGSHLF